MDESSHIPVTATEIGSLWTQYLTDSANVCVYSYFVEKVEDPEIKPMLEHALQLSKAHIQKITAIMKKENRSIPHGFSLEEDVDLTAPRLYTDTYFLHNVHQMAAIGLTIYAGYVAASVRADITEFYSSCLQETALLYKRSKDVLLSKGLYTRGPFMPVKAHVEYVEKQGFIWDVFAEKKTFDRHGNIQSVR
ncbi:DUF3231 family protein [Virgibacillus halophilus]|uniref:DUF3231 family protein n=1 Tax=Tigheibacillus halophilus TaxID=361280 RepID=A0ABU5C559_9BACI|nr:DUF3231 family protein [Virgibacillus halophilus]